MFWCQSETKFFYFWDRYFWLSCFVGRSVFFTVKKSVALVLWLVYLLSPYCLYDNKKLNSPSFLLPRISAARRFQPIKAIATEIPPKVMSKIACSFRTPKSSFNLGKTVTFLTSLFLFNRPVEWREDTDWNKWWALYLWLIILVYFESRGLIFLGLTIQCWVEIQVKFQFTCLPLNTPHCMTSGFSE